MKNEEYTPHPDPLHVGREGDIASTYTSECVPQDTPMIHGLGGLGNMPHLIIIDGGKGQLSSALAGIDDGVRAYREQNISRMKNEK
jgi:hypothetical protein